MTRGRKGRPGSYNIRVETRDDYLRRIAARQSRALISGRLNTFPRMEYWILPPILGLFGCTSLSEYFFSVGFI